MVKWEEYIAPLKPLKEDLIVKRGKNYIESAKLIDRTKFYDAAEGFDLVCKASKAKFDDKNLIIILHPFYLS